MPFQLPDLPFSKDALAPVMSAETLEFHHGKHHKAYVTKTNELIESDRDLDRASLLQVIKHAQPRRIRVVGKERIRKVISPRVPFSYTSLKLKFIYSKFSFAIYKN